MKAKHIALLFALAVLVAWIAPGRQDSTVQTEIKPRTPQLNITTATKRPTIQQPSAANKDQSGFRVTGQVGLSIDSGTAVAEDQTQNPLWIKAVADATAQMKQIEARKNEAQKKTN